MDNSSGIEVLLRKSAFRNRIKTYRYKNIEFKDLLPFLKECQRIFVVKTREVVNELASVKLNAILEAQFTRPVSNDNNEHVGEQLSTFYFQSEMKQITPTTRLNEWFEKNVTSIMLEKIDQFQENGSGWTLNKIVCLDINYNKHVHFSGSSYLPLPKSIKNKKATVNVKNFDNQCFKWAILSALHPATKNVNRLSNYERFKNELKFDGMTFPISVSDISKFEMLNTNISVNVYILEKEYNFETKRYKRMILPIRLTPKVKVKHVHLLLIFETDIDDNDDSEDDEDHNRKNQNLSKVITQQMRESMLSTHYVWIKNLSAMIRSQVTINSRRAKYICDRCLHYFYSDVKLNNHSKICEQINNSKISLPTFENRWIFFENHKNKIEVPFIIYADIESLLVTKQSEDNGNNKKIPKGMLQEHIPNSIGYYLHSRLDMSLSHYDTFIGKNCIEKFIARLKNLMISVIWDKLHKVNPMFLNIEDRQNFENATTCHICHKEFVQIGPEDDELPDKFYEMRKVRDHCHITGKFRGAAHSKCNFKFQISKTIPIVFHNLDYDSHFLISELANSFEGRISIIPKTSENYISFTKEMLKSDFINETNTSNCDDTDDYQEKKKKPKHREILRLKFIDSYRFLQCSLAKLAKYLPIEKLKISRQEWSNLDDDKFKLLTEKGVYPYSYMNSWEKFNEKNLPPINDFYDELNDSDISEEQYAFAKKIWKEFQIKTMRDYTDLYLKTDVLLLADIFENFRDSCIKLYELDPAHYYTLPGYSWDCMLKYTKVNIELITEIDHLLFVERGLRGGISQCSNRYCEANNKYMQNDFNPNKPSNYLIYFDVNNLYGWAMTQSLPLSNFSWYKKDELENIEKMTALVMNTPDDAEFGYMLEVDLEYPQKLHDLHNDYPFCCEHLQTSNNSKVKKLVLTLYDKSNYIIHYRMLKLVLKNGLVLKKVHQILQFKQSKWLKEYIMLNTNERKKSTNDFEKDLYKATNNAIFGKSMENVRDRVDIKLITKWDGRYGLKALTAKPNFKRNVIFNENLVACELKRLNIDMIRPVIVGTTILEVSKVLMYSFHYDFMLKNFNVDDCRIQYTDTDSFIYEIKKKDIYEFMKTNCEKFDTSAFAIPNPFNIVQQNKKVVGVMKDENSGKIVKEFIGLRSKMYAIRMHSKLVTKRAKGIRKNILNNRISFKDFKKCITRNSIIKRRQCTIRSFLHNVYTVSNIKKALDPFDDKRFIIPNSHETLAWGHYKIDSFTNSETIL